MKLCNYDIDDFSTLVSYIVFDTRIDENRSSWKVRGFMTMTEVRGYLSEVSSLFYDCGFRSTVVRDDNDDIIVHCSAIKTSN